MHLHRHLAERIRDFGPVYSFWCFAFERISSALQRILENSLFLYPVKSHVVYTKSSVDFGRVVRNDTVYVVVPLASNL